MEEGRWSCCYSSARRRERSYSQAKARKRRTRRNLCSQGNRRTHRRPPPEDNETEARRTQNMKRVVNVSNRIQKKNPILDTQTRRQPTTFRQRERRKQEIKPVVQLPTKGSSANTCRWELWGDTSFLYRRNLGHVHGTKGRERERERTSSRGLGTRRKCMGSINRRWGNEGLGGDCEREDGGGR